jgi:putative addiction module killer protein
MDLRTKAAIDARVARFRSGNLGDSKPVGDGVSEARIDYGPGHRIYYGVDGGKIILLCGGDKSTQVGDIELAKSFWLDYKKRTRRGEADR